MNILMFTNTYSPHVGGVAASVDAFANIYRQRGHQVMVVAPEFEHMTEDEVNVIRISAIQNFNGSDFSFVPPIPHFLDSEITLFEPDIIHSHHPFLLGSLAMQVASTYTLPIFFTHHTMYEQYTHYVPGDSETLKKFAIELATSYANTCDHVFTPSDSIKTTLQKREVITPMTVIPTGVKLDKFVGGSGSGFKSVVNIPDEAFVIGHLGRLAPEKNLAYLTEAVIKCMTDEANTYFLIVGKGSSEQVIRDLFNDAGLSDRLHFIGALTYPEIVSAYKAMDIFVFCSQSETQGMVITEAMAAGTPVIALDAPGVREVVVDKENGCLLNSDSTSDKFAQTIQWYCHQPKDARDKLSQAALKTAQSFSIELCADKALAVYEQGLGKSYIHRHREFEVWSNLLPTIKAEWNTLKRYATAASDVLMHNKTGNTDHDL
ncbi:MAG: 1,2-diacylglycerol 3-alpha-glucosyltransferase [Arenicella sp.]|jgi:1,2-diacylglycerol 3-alpha-glucosyltransferase